MEVRNTRLTISLRFVTGCTDLDTTSYGRTCCFKSTGRILNNSDGQSRLLKRFRLQGHREEETAAYWVVREGEWRHEEVAPGPRAPPRRCGGRTPCPQAAGGPFQQPASG